MPNIFYSCKVIDREAFFDEHEVHHFKVLRLKKGDEIRFTDGKGGLFEGKIQKVSTKEAVANIEKIQRISKEWKDRIFLCLASSKWQRERLLIEKAVELGVDCIVEFKSEKSVVQDRKIEKLDLLVRNSLKQSFNLFKPEIMLFNNLNDFINWAGSQHDLHFVLFDFNGERLNNIVIPRGDIGLIIGPEGGFSKFDLEKLDSLNPLKVKLGERILRFETAALVGIIVFSYLKGKLY